MAYFSLFGLLVAASIPEGVAMTVLGKRWNFESLNIGSQSSLNLSSLNPALPAMHYLFMAHHKIGTMLGAEVAQMMSQQLGTAYAQINWTDLQVDQGYNCPGGSDTATVAAFEDMRGPVIEKLYAECQPMRGIHFVRDLPEALVSNYVYFKGLSPGRPGCTEPLELQIRGAWYRNLTLREGLRIDCEWLLNSNTQQAVDVHQVIMRDNITDILEVSYDDVEKDFYGTFETIFKHLLGADQTMLPSLMTGVRPFDIGLWSKEKVESFNNYGDPEEKAKARREFWRLAAEGETCAVELLRRTRLLGFPGEAPPDHH